MINCLNKLSTQERLEDDIREAELTGTFLDPILNPIFYDPEKNRLFRWLNTGIDDTESLRPDGNEFELEQRRIKFSTGYVEVKPDKSRSVTLKTHEDLLRLVNFCKDTGFYLLTELYTLLMSRNLYLNYPSSSCILMKSKK
ncbi:hypothetical protein BD770DRAFT_381527 [Pilaira anomala]|nr:hypothetical protein BD770DRAFT_381527 [Pilaira anomala]